uniref:WD_REPEATS_REGION domain-containing protein n=1 Tax=Setaria digitata TaxID=48799 RepID=A0A915PDH3_9BILA
MTQEICLDTLSREGFAFEQMVLHLTYITSRGMVVEEFDGAFSRQAFYTRIYRQLFSPDGNWLVVTDSLAHLYLFELRHALELNASSNERRFKCLLKLDEPVYALSSVHSRIVCGNAVGQLAIYDWNDIIHSDTSDPCFPISKFNGFPAGLSVAPPCEINAVSCINNRYILYAGAGDNAIRLVEIERPDKVISTFVGHTEYVNELAVQSEHVFLSSSEDGTVRLWDTRSKDLHIFNVASEEKLRRRNCGKGICALDIEEDFMVCGGDVELAIWHIGSRSLASPLCCERPPLMRYTVAKMNGDRILIGGSSSDLMQFDYSGQHLTSVKTSLRSIYSIETNLLGPNAMTVVAGDSVLINAFLNLGYVSFCFSTSST